MVVKRCGSNFHAQNPVISIGIHANQEFQVSGKDFLMHISKCVQPTPPPYSPGGGGGGGGNQKADNSQQHIAPASESLLCPAAGEKTSRSASWRPT